jgi:hypothetical protein
MSPVVAEAGAADATTPAAMRAVTATADKKVRSLRTGIHAPADPVLGMCLEMGTPGVSGTLSGREDFAKRKFSPPERGEFPMPLMHK